MSIFAPAHIAPRPADAYARAHLEGARSVLWDEVRW